MILGNSIVFDLFNASVLSMVLYNSETWGSDIQKRTFKVLDGLFLLFFHTIFHIGAGTPSFYFFWESATVKVHFQILERTLMFIYHFANLPDSALSKQIYNQQLSESLPGLITKNKGQLQKIHFDTNKCL